MVMATQQSECAARRRSAHLHVIKTASFMLHILTTVNEEFKMCVIQGRGHEGRPGELRSRLISNISTSLDIHTEESPEITNYKPLP